MLPLPPGEASPRYVRLYRKLVMKLSRTMGLLAACLVLCSSRPTPASGQGGDELFAAIYRGRVEEVEKALASGADVNAVDERRRTPLIVAAEVMGTVTGNLDVLRLLLRSGADMYWSVFPQGTALRICVHNGHLECVRTLIEHGFDLNSHPEEGTPAIFIAVGLDHRTEVLRLLLEHGADPEFREPSSGRRPIFAAVALNHLDDVRLLLEHGASPARQLAPGAGGSWPLNIAVASGYFDMMRLLVEHGANVNAQDASGEAPLHRTVHNLTPETVTFLVEEGASLNVRNNDGDTPVMRAVAYRKVEHARALLAAGADPNIRNRYGHSPLSIAEVNKHEEMIALLRAAGAR